MQLPGDLQAARALVARPPNEEESSACSGWPTVDQLDFGMPSPRSPSLPSMPSGRRMPHTHVFLVPTRKGDILDGFFNALERFQG